MQLLSKHSARSFTLLHSPHHSTQAHTVPHASTCVPHIFHMFYTPDTCCYFEHIMYILQTCTRTLTLTVTCTSAKFSCMLHSLFYMPHAEITHHTPQSISTLNLHVFSHLLLYLHSFFCLLHVHSVLRHRSCYILHPTLYITHAHHALLVFSKTFFPHLFFYVEDIPNVLFRISSHVRWHTLRITSHTFLFTAHHLQFSILQSQVAGFTFSVYWLIFTHVSAFLQMYVPLLTMTGTSTLHWQCLQSTFHISMLHFTLQMVRFALSDF